MNKLCIRDRSNRSKNKKEMYTPQKAVECAVKITKGQENKCKN